MMDANNRILIVDDDAGVRNSYRDILKREEKRNVLSEGAALFSGDLADVGSLRKKRYDLTLVESGEQGVAAVRQSVEEGRPFAMAFVDMKMPGIDGAETARQIWELDPFLFIVIVTAYSDVSPDWIVHLAGREDLLYLRKPFNINEIKQFARCLTAQWALRQERHLLADRLRIANEGLEQQVEERTRELKRSEDALKATLAIQRRALGATIEALAATAEARDPYTAGHQRRVANLSRAIATEMGLPKDDIEAIHMAGAIHDIGKIRVPSEILNRPGKITSLEMQLIRMHPEVGYEILKGIDFPWPVAEIELQHHERLDGSGYPQGLKDGEILIQARVIAVADVVEAMTSHRPYRPALGIDVALAEIEKNRGILYDAEAVDACLRLFREKGFQLG
jgi:putative two-component system response regulator